MSTEKYQSYPQGKENIQTLDEEASELKSQAKTLKEDATEKIQEVKGKLQQKGHGLQEKDENYPNADYQGQAPETIEPEQFEETKAQSEQKKDKIINLAEKWVEKVLSAEITLEHDMRQKISDKISYLKENIIQKKEQLIRAEISLEHELTQKISEKVEDLKRSLIEKKDQLVRAEITLEHEVLQKVHLDPSQKKEQQQKYEQLSSQDADTTQPAEIDFRSAFSAQNPTLSTQFTQGFQSIMSTISQGVQTVKRKLSAATEAQYTRIKTTTSADEEEYPRTYHVGEEFREIIAGFSKIVDEDWQDERVDELRKVGVSENPFEPFGTKDIQVSGSLVGGDELVFKAQGVSSSRGLTERAGKDIERLDRQLNQVISGKGEESGYQGFKDITNEVSGKNQAIKEGGKGSLVSEDKKNLSGKGQGKAGNEKARVYESENMMNIA